MQGLSSFALAWTITLTVVDNLLRITALFVVPRNRRPTSGMAWLMAIFWLPIPGFLLFLVIGSNRLPKHRTEKQETINGLVTGIAERENNKLVSNHDDLPAALVPAVKLGTRLGAQPMLSGNAASMSINYEQSLLDIAKAIDEAETFVHIEFYILALDDTTRVLFDAMRRAIERGVEVRVLLDHIASVRNMYGKETREELDDMNAQWSYMLPVRPWRGEYQRPDLRNHRKLAIIDGKVGFMGSLNIIDASYNLKKNLRRGLLWRDLMVRLEGPVVLGLEAVFQGDWYIETGEFLEHLSPFETFVDDETKQPGDLDCQILPSGPGYANENNLQVFVALLYTAQHRISITSPYFVPDGSIMNALRAATARGVEVELFVSEIGDQPLVYHAQRSYYEELLRAGVRIFMYKPPFILHAKHFTIDTEVAVVGSSNMDQRSFGLNMEVSMIVHGTEFVRDLDEVNDYYRENSRELLDEEWSQQPLRSQLFDNLARLTSALQ
ncbi:cardiolipin synthase [Leucobacter sp. UCMA 4100]|uniref:cardiolipin synthase n=1 Tax=Leucobacter sp. UCMA 4100 TaxID=2810534 RepID=UPI0022EB563B|nr:cardiolipin synthase [Leucobacter sp. UCMA 4100]MDA3146291.1 cardiolipin synthase [Leucobacter sp. UCMA 4100]